MVLLRRRFDVPVLLGEALDVAVPEFSLDDILKILSYAF